MIFSDATNVILAAWVWCYIDYSGASKHDAGMTLSI
jgi:hypothetical protein